MMKLASLGRLLAPLVLLFVTLVSPTVKARAQAPPTLPSEESKASSQDADPLAVEARSLRASIEENTEKARELDAQAKRATGEDLSALEEQAWEARLRVHNASMELVANVLKQEEEGRDVANRKKALGDELAQVFPRYEKHLDWRQARIDKLRKQRDEASGEERADLDQALDDEEAKAQQAYGAMAETVGAMESLQVDASGPRAIVTKRLRERAEMLSGRIKVAQRELEAMAKKLTANPDNAELQETSAVAQARLDRLTANLAATAKLLDGFHVDTAEYRQLLIRTTGQLTKDVLNKDVALGLLKSWRERVTKFLLAKGTGWAFNALFFLLILAVFRVLASFTRRVVSRAVRSSQLNLSQLLQKTLVSWSTRTVMLIGLLVALSQLGFQIGPLLAGLGIAGFIVGFALQDTLANFAAGAMILLYRPFDLNDVIEAAGISGKVSRMSMVSTTILTFDNQTLIVPNSKIWGDVIRNVTAQQRRRVDLVFGIGYGDDIVKAEAVLKDIVDKHDKVLRDPEPLIKLYTLGDSSVDFIVRPWCRTQDYWDVYWDITREVKMRFDREGISIPFPQRDVHLYKADCHKTEEPQDRSAGGRDGAE